MTKNLNRMIATILIITTVFWNCSSYVGASVQEQKKVITKDQAPMEQTVKPFQFESKEEAVIDKTCNTTTYLTEEGLKELVVHSSNVRFETEDGELLDYDPSLVEINDGETTELGKNLDGYIYKNQIGDSKNYIPEKLTQETPILLENKEFSISFRPVFEGEQLVVQKDENTEALIDELLEENNVESIDENVSILSLSKYSTQEKMVQSENNEEEAFFIESEVINQEDLTSAEIDTEVVETIYEEEVEIENTGIYTVDDDSIQMRYTSLDNGIKETIVLNEIPASNLFSFEFTVENMIPVYSETGKEILLVKEDTEDIVGVISAPFMNDATEEAYSEDISYQVIKKIDSEDTYILHMIVSEDYLKDENRVYPVAIDPTVSWTGPTQIYDTYVIGKDPYKDMNFYTNDVIVMSAGYGNQGVFRTYMQFVDFKSKLSGFYVDSAKLTIYETANSKKGQTVRVHRVSESWNKSTVTWNNRPSYISTVLDSSVTAGTAGAEHTLDVTSYARNVANGSQTNYGLVLRTVDESSGTYTQFYSSRHGTTARRPKLSIVYYDGPTKPTSMNLNTTYLKKGSKLTVNWEGIVSKNLNYVEYRVGRYNTATGEVEPATNCYVPYTKLLTTTSSSGSRTINESANWAEGVYKLYIRGVDKGGIIGTTRNSTFYIDGTAPVFISGGTGISTSSSASVYSKNATPTIKWNVTETYFDRIECYVNDIYVTKWTSNSSTGTAIPSSVIKTPGEYKIKLIAYDKAGNSKEQSIGTYYYDGTVPNITALSLDTLTSGVTYSNKTTPVLSYTVSDATLNKLEYSINNGTYKTITPVASSGKVTLNISAQGKNTITLRATDKAGNMATKSVDYYFDSVAPVFNTTGTGIVTGSSSSSYSNNATPTVRWSVTESNFDRVECYVNNSQVAVWKSISSTGITIPASIMNSTGEYSIRLIAYDKAENKKEVKYTYYYWNNDKILNATVYLQNDKKEIINILENKAEVYYQVLDPKGVFKNVKLELVDSNNTVIQNVSVNSSLKENTITIDNSKLYNGTYYLVLTVTDKVNNITIQKIEFTVERPELVDENITSTNRLGIKENLGYVNFDTPNGSGAVEKSKGNIYYSQNDISLPNKELNFALTRIYNSQSTEKTMFGNGWDFGQAMRLYATQGSNNLWLRDSTGNRIEFDYKGTSYTQIGGKEYTLEASSGKFETIAYTYVLQDKSANKYYFNSYGYLIRIVATNAAYLQFTYDEQKRLSKIVSDTEKNIMFTYTSDNTVDTIILPDNSYMKYSYKNGRLSSASRIKDTYNNTNQLVKQEKVTYEYSYNTNGLLEHIIDAEGNVYKITYTNELKPNKIVYPTGEYLQITYDTIAEYGSGKTTTVVKKITPNNQVLYTESSKVDLASGYINVYTDAIGLTTTHEYEGNRLIKQVTPSSYQIVNEKQQVVVKEYDIIQAYSYDNNDNLLNTSTVYKYKEGTEQVIRTEEYQYNDKNYPNLQTLCKITGENGQLIQHTAYSYTSTGDIEKETDYIAKTAVDTNYKENIDGSEEQSSTESLDGNQISTTTTVTDANGNVQNAETTDSTATLKEEYQYDTMGNLVYIKDKKARITRYEYDFLGRLVCTTYEYLGNVKETKSYNANGTIQLETSKDGTVTSYTYDEFNRVVTKTIEKAINGTKKEETWKTDYSYEDNVTIYTGKNEESCNYNTLYVERTYNTKQKDTNNQQIYSYVKYINGKGQTVRELKDGLLVDYTYDAMGRVIVGSLCGQEIKSQGPSRVTLTLYDKDGNQTYTITNPSYSEGVFAIDEKTTNVTKSEYDTNGNVVAVTDAEGNITKYEYDKSSRVTKVVLFNQNENGEDINLVSKYAYDIIDTLDTINKNTSINNTIVNIFTNAKGIISKTQVDSSGRILSITDNPTGTSLVTKNVYDDEGDLKEIHYTDQSYDILSYYNGSKLLENKISYDSYKNEKTKTYYTYYSNDKEKEMIDYQWENDEWKLYRYAKYEYDLLDRVVAFYEVNATVLPTEEQLEKAKVEYRYNFEGQIERIQFSNNKDITALKYSYNTNNWLEEIHAITPTSGEDGTIMRAYEYDNNGKIKSYKDYTSVLETSDHYIKKEYSYDSFDRVTAMVYYDSSNLSKVVEGYNYQYDKNSNITYEKISYSYDSIQTTLEKTYRYDKIGQLVYSKVVVDGKDTIQTNYHYDEVGNRIKIIQNDVITEYQYNALNQLEKSVGTDQTTKTIVSNVIYTYTVNGEVSTKKDSVTGEHVTYQYNNEGQVLVAEGLKDGNTTFTQKNTYNGNGQRIRKVEDGITTNYYYQGTQVLYTTDEVGRLTSYNYFGLSDNVMATTRYDGGKTSYYVYNKDIHGSSSNLITSSGKSIKGYTYDDYGTATAYGDTGFYNEITYTGAIYDESTGLYYLNARYYDAELGRFLSQDSYRGEEKDAGTWNLYAYCANDPINYVDPSGHFAIAASLGAWAASEFIGQVVIGFAVSVVVTKTGYDVVTKATSSNVPETTTSNTSITNRSPKLSRKQQTLIKAEIRKKCNLYKSYIKQLDNLNENKRNHIINGSKNSDHHWERLTPNKNWTVIKKAVARTMTFGRNATYKGVDSKLLRCKGNLVEVPYKQIGTIKRISNAWIKN